MKGLSSSRGILCSLVPQSSSESSSATSEIRRRGAASITMCDGIKRHQNKREASERGSGSKLDHWKKEREKHAGTTLCLETASGRRRRRRVQFYLEAL